MKYYRHMRRSAEKIVFVFLSLAAIHSHFFAQDSTHHHVFAFISDTQSPFWFESFKMKRNQNERATAMLFDSILRDSTLSAVFHFGDVTESGSRTYAWQTIDTVLEQAHRRNLPIYATIGNHDYLYSASIGEINFRKRFPMFQPTGYSVRFGSIVYILLNSNFSKLLRKERARQLEWYTKKLDSLECDSTVAFVIVGCHHPPYTNNTIVIARSDDVRQYFVPQFLEHRKCKLFLSGHTHALEHFKIGEKDFLVLGGGGGSQHTLLMKEKSREMDLFPQQTEKRMFHYIRAEMNGNVFTVTVMMIRDDFSGLYPADTFTIPIIE